ncbi:hypothetical protein CsSME_00029691 [Camellia sinensis var. sinensis]
MIHFLNCPLWKGSSTILRFFQSCNNSSSTPRQEHVGTIDETKASSSSSNSEIYL